MKLDLTLDLNDINKAVKDLNRYAESLDAKALKFVQKLAEVGIHIANENATVIDDLGDTRDLVLFYSTTNTVEDGAECIVYGIDSTTLTQSWLTMEKDANGFGTGVIELKTAEVSPILMLEFGSGFNAVKGKKKQGLNYPDIAESPQGTFPEQTHAFDPNGWSWRDVDGEWHHSKGIVPTQPMYKAWEEMYKQIRAIGREVFKEI